MLITFGGNDCALEDGVDSAAASGLRVLIARYSVFSLQRDDDWPFLCALKSDNSNKTQF